MTVAIERVAILGAGGTLGRYVYKALVKAGFVITVISRPESTTTYPEGTRVVSVPYTLDGFKEAFAGHDAVVSVVGLAATLSQIAMIDAAVALGVKRFIPSYFGYEFRRARLPELEPFGEPKFKVLEHAEATAARHGDFTFTSIAPGVFFDWAMVRFPAMGFDLQAKSVQIVDDGTAEFTGTSMHHIADAVAGTLKNLDGTANRHIRVRSFQTTQNDLVAALKLVSGHEWSQKTVSGDGLLAQGRSKLQSGDRSGMLDLLTVQLFSKDLEMGVLVSSNESDNKLVGIIEEDMETLTKRVLGWKDMDM